ncbi:hypothetical protein CMI37_08975 [Candidatus Pacearchaeota archaeon]|nr:hypothetical protein [Candidatus Pacearchaeota archaeon]
MAMARVTIRRNGQQDTVTVKDNGNAQVWDLSHMSKVEHEGVRELVVNWWCDKQSIPRLFDNPVRRT